MLIDRCLRAFSAVMRLLLMGRQRMVHEALGEHMKTIHALTMKTWTPEQWEQRKGTIPALTPHTVQL